jgi:uncharacterized protein
VLEVDAVRKRISLSIKQTMEAPQRANRPPGKKDFGGGRDNNRNEPQKEVTMGDALSLLKKKFGK